MPDQLFIERWVFTFGAGQVDPVDGSSLKDSYVVAPEGLGEVQARVWMIERFGLHWSGVYPTKGAAGVYQFGLREHVPHDPDSVGDLAIRLRLGARYFAWDYWRVITLDAADQLVAGADPLKVVHYLRTGRAPE